MRRTKYNFQKQWLSYLEMQNLKGCMQEDLGFLSYWKK